ncbi:hypothetical protein A4E84_22170 [Streptomyces qaidamensis]|uniref:Uncharacterized protein n=1 Tax=Streptomyces qaidamensis TaxID=1783515 RepID=A0A143C391_9ACTN|nr:hypothetical protein A4E84_22170 [Streptomyces qaidamensis]
MVYQLRCDSHFVGLPQTLRQERRQLYRCWDVFYIVKEACALLLRGVQGSRQPAVPEGFKLRSFNELSYKLLLFSNEKMVDDLCD